MILYFYNYSYLRSRHSVVNERMRTLGDVEVNNVAGRKVIEPAVDKNFPELALPGLFPSFLNSRAVNNVLYGHLDVLLDQVVHIASLG